MKKNRSVRRLLTVLLAAAALAVMASASVSAETVKLKLLKTSKTYDGDGKLQNSYSYAYDAKGNVTKIVRSEYNNGVLKDKSTTTYKNTYWKGTSNLKKVVAKGPNSSFTNTFTKAGALQKQVYIGPDGEKSTTIYKSSGKRLKSSVTKTASGKVEYKETYDSKGNLKTYVYYDDNGKAFTTRYSYKYKNGKVTGQTIASENWTNTYTFDKNGNAVKRVERRADGTTLTYTIKNTYKKGYLTQSREYNSEGGLMRKVVTTYTAKTYTINR